MSKTIEERVFEIVVNQLNVNEKLVTRSAELSANLGADSLDTVELVIAFEEEFKDELGGVIPDEQLDRFVKVGDVIDYIEKKAGDAKAD